MSRAFFCFTLCLVSLFAGPAAAQPAAVAEAPAKSTLQLASVFSDHMVLQRHRPIPVWGNASPGTDVRVTLGDETQSATADEAGGWRVEMPALEAGGPLEMTISAGDNTTKFSDILIGEVWLASGQSNMQWTVENSNDAEQEIADAANWPKIRLLTVPRTFTTKPQLNIDAEWQLCDPKTIKPFSAVAYSFGRALQQELDVPIGLISTNYGGTPMEAWTSAPGLKSRPEFEKYVKTAEKARADDAKINQGHPTGLFNAMIHPLVPYGIRGAIWYQGEADAGRHAQYRALSVVMISDWRERWGQGDFPFLLVQLAAWTPDAKDWPLLRESQQETVQTVPNTAMAVATDIGNKGDIHPRNKQDVGKRLALAARNLAYGEDIVYSGPMYRNMYSLGGKAYLHFDSVGGGLKVKGDTLNGFTVAGADRDFVPATAKIEGDHVVVSSEGVPHPVAVRYNWAGWTEGTLFNTNGLPAPPFRTDRY